MYAFSMLPVIIGIFAVIAGSGLIVSDEEHGRLDLIIAHPVGRTPFFWGRFLGLLACSIIHLLFWAGWDLVSCLGAQAWVSPGIRWQSLSCPCSFRPLCFQPLHWY